MTRYIDSHAHLTSDEVFEQIDPILERAQRAGIDSVVNICTDDITLERGLALVKKYPWVYNTAATTPHDVEKEGEALFPLMEKHARAGDLVAVGETGLDYHYHHASPDVQQRFLRRYLQLALETALPVVIHCREAFGDLFRIIDSDYKQNNKHSPGVLHCFTGTIEEAEGVLQRGWLLSLSGIVTFKKGEVLREVAKMVPLNQLLIETDTPYLAPQSKRGLVNEPAYLVETAFVIASAKGLTLEEVASATRSNAQRFFNLETRIGK